MGYDSLKFFEFPKATPTDKGLRLIFACLPSGIAMPVTFDFLNENRKKLPSPFSSTTDYIHDFTFPDQPQWWQL